MRTRWPYRASPQTGAADDESAYHSTRCQSSLSPSQGLATNRKYRLRPPTADTGVRPGGTAMGVKELMITSLPPLAVRM